MTRKPLSSSFKALAVALALIIVSAFCASAQPVPSAAPITVPTFLTSMVLSNQTSLGVGAPFAIRPYHSLLFTWDLGNTNSGNVSNVVATFDVSLDRVSWRTNIFGITNACPNGFTNTFVNTSSNVVGFWARLGGLITGQTNNVTVGNFQVWPVPAF